MDKFEEMHLKPSNDRKTSLIMSLLSPKDISIIRIHIYLIDHIFTYGYIIYISFYCFIYNSLNNNLTSERFNN